MIELISINKYYINLLGESFSISISGFWLSINCWIIFPVTAPKVTPVVECPVEIIKLSIFDVNPITGNPSGDKGLIPHQISSEEFFKSISIYECIAFFIDSILLGAIFKFNPDNSSVPAALK